MDPAGTTPHEAAPAGTAPATATATTATSADAVLDLWRQRWRGEAGRLEIWYATVTDRTSGAGLWVHGEVVAPTDGEPHGQPGGPVAHGWCALFPDGGEPVWARTARHDATPPPDDESAPLGFVSDDLVVSPTGTHGRAGSLRWRVDWDSDGQVPLETLPRRAWDRELLPAAHIVAAPTMEAVGWVDHDGVRTELAGHAQAARMFGHGNARRWAWLHADLGDGVVVELVTARSTHRLLGALPPLTFLRLRVGGTDWPVTGLASWGLRNDLALPTWRVRGRTSGVVVDIEVHQPPGRCVSVDYTDPDGSASTCTNTEQADLRMVLRAADGATRTWIVDGTAHAEVGTRP